MAKLAEQTKRYEQMVEVMKIVAAESYELTVEERNLLSIAYKNVTGARFDALCIISSFEQKQENRGNNSHVSGLRRPYRWMRSKIEYEHYRSVMMKGDYHPATSLTLRRVERRAAAESALSAYESAQDITFAKLDPVHPIRLDVAVNLSTFYYEFLNSPDKAYNLAKQAYDEAYKILLSYYKKKYSPTIRRKWI